MENNRFLFFSKLKNPIFTALKPFYCPKITSYQYATHQGPQVKHFLHVGQKKFFSKKKIFWTLAKFRNFRFSKFHSFEFSVRNWVEWYIVCTFSVNIWEIRFFLQFFYVQMPIFTLSEPFYYLFTTSNQLINTSGTISESFSTRWWKKIFFKKKNFFWPPANFRNFRFLKFFSHFWIEREKLSRMVYSFHWLRWYLGKPDFSEFRKFETPIISKISKIFEFFFRYS